MPLLDDIVRRVHESFSGSDRDKAAGLLLGTRIHDGSLAEPRLQRCALVASQGSLETLQYYVKLLAVDFATSLWRESMSQSQVSLFGYETSVAHSTSPSNNRWSGP